MTKSFACTAVSLPNSLLWLSYNRSQDQQKCLRTVFSATYSGLTQKKVSQVGVKTTAVSLILSEKPLLSSSSKKTILTSFVVEDGYEFFCGRQLVTVFSAPNYCGEFDNSGALMSVDDTLMCSFSILRATDPARAGG